MAKLPAGRYVILWDAENGYTRGAIVDSLRFKKQLRDGVYPHGTLVEHILSGKIFRIDITPRITPFGALTERQKDRAERYRQEWWPKATQRSRPRSRRK